ncbi:MAG TPA: hypothetical protein VMB34_07075 [Acetobacteraceae bacterium]|nr:hypothetical protein [Acetobacteraceae bacterium]
MENRLQALYWAELVQLKVSCEYIRRYRDSLGAWVTRFAVIRAVVSVSALGTWAAVKAYPMVWGGIIAAAQVADALQSAVPFSARFRSTNALLVALEALLIDCQMEWEDIYAGRLDENEINKRRHAMMKLRHEAEVKNLPNGLPVRSKLFRLAEDDAAAYFRNTDQTGGVE